MDYAETLHEQAKHLREPLPLVRLWPYFSSLPVKDVPMF
jgi:hypothetical protein